MLNPNPSNANTQNPIASGAFLDDLMAPSGNYTSGMSSTGSSKKTSAKKESSTKKVIPSMDPYSLAINTGVAVLDAGLGLYAANEERKEREEAKREAKKMFERNWQLAAEERRKRDYAESQAQGVAAAQRAQGFQDRARMRGLQESKALGFLGKV